MIAGLSGRTERDPTAFVMVFYFRMRAAWILWQQRRKAGLAAHYAAACVGIDEWKLRRYELGIDSPPLRTIHRLLTRYNADEAAIFFFCTIPFPAPGIYRFARMALTALKSRVYQASKTSYPLPDRLS